MSSKRPINTSSEEQENTVREEDMLVNLRPLPVVFSGPPAAFLASSFSNAPPSVSSTASAASSSSTVKIRSMSPGHDATWSTSFSPIFLPPPSSSSSSSSSLSTSSSSSSSSSRLPPSLARHLAPAPRVSFVARGGFGCIVRPAIQPSTDNLLPGHVTKLFVRKGAKDFNEQKAMNERIRQLDPTGSFAIVNTHQGKVRLANLDQKLVSDHIVEGGDPTQFIKGHLDGVHSMVYPDAGRDVFAALDDTDFISLFRCFRVPLQGVQQLVAKRVIHHDIKLENIMFDGAQMRMIDFGLSRSFANMYQATWDALDMDIWPPEFHLADQLHDTKKLNQISKELNAQKSTKLRNIFLTARRKIEQQAQDMLINVDATQNPELHAALREIANGQDIRSWMSLETDKVEAAKTRGPTSFHRPLLDLATWCRTWLHKFDVYSLGVALLTMLTEAFHMRQMSQLHSRSEWYGGVARLCVDMIRPNPEQRFTIEQALQRYDDLIQELDRDRLSSSAASSSSSSSSQGPSAKRRKPATPLPVIWQQPANHDVIDLTKD